MTNGNWVQDPDNPEFWYWVTGEGAVLSVNGKTGEVVLTYADVGAMPDTFTESDPTVPSYVKAISQEDIDNWNAGGSGSGNPVTISETAPEDAGEGDLWFCTLESELGLYCYDGTTWFEVGGSNSSGGGPSPSGDSSGVVISPTEPTDKFEGMLWLNSDTAEVFIFDGAVWLEFPAGSSGSGGGLWEQNGDDIYYSDGNVGIGTDNPILGKLVVKDAAPFVIASSTSAAGSGYCMFVNDGNSGVGVISTDNGGHMTFDTGATGTSQAERMRIDADGNVGIGTDAPDSPLTVRAYSTELGANDLQSWKYDNQFDLKLRQDISPNLVKYSFDLQNLGTTYLNNLVLDRGNVGIGTSDPTTILTLKRDSSGTSQKDYPLLSLDNGNGSGYSHIRFAQDGSEVVGFVVNNDEKNLIIRAGGAVERMRIGADGRVDISGSLYVNGTPKIGYSELITTLVTLRKATMDETQDIRESLRDAIDELVAGFEQEIAAMPAPEPEVSTQEIPE